MNCYVRHEVSPGVHQDIPHTHEEVTMTDIEELRSVKLQLRLISKELEGLAVQERNHPGKPHSGENTPELVAKWVSIRAGYDKRRTVLAQERDRLANRKRELNKHFTQQPLSKISLGHIIDRLVDIEGQFAVEGWEAAWDNVSRFIDWLEQDSHRIEIEEQIIKAETDISSRTHESADS